MKAIAKQIAAITFTALFLIALNVKAEGTENTTLNNETVESVLELENWMTNEALWNSNATTNLEITTETEAGLNMEEWMTNSETWNISFTIETEKEAPLELENWMTQDMSMLSIQTESDSKLQLEAWMINENIWK